MKQTIEQMRAQAAREHETGEVMAAFPQISAIRSFYLGAEWEAKRYKWNNIDNGLPNLKGWYLTRVRGSSDPHLLFFGRANLNYQWFDVLEWAEIPL